MTPKFYDMGNAVSGDTLRPFSLQAKINGSAPTHALSSVTATLSQAGAITATLTATINSSSLWTISISASGATMAINSGVHKLNITTVDSAGLDRTYIQGKINILPKL